MTLEEKIMFLNQLLRKEQLVLHYLRTIETVTFTIHINIIGVKEEKYSVALEMDVVGTIQSIDPQVPFRTLLDIALQSYLIRYFQKWLCVDKGVDIKFHHYKMDLI